MKGKLIIIESGTDSSGKATQTRLLYEKLKEEGYPVKKVEFPNYQSPSSALVKMYLKGDFGQDPGEVDPYISSTFYAVDRYASYKTEWEDFYHRGGIILADRYTTSNMVHQGAKLKGKEKDKYLDWLWDLEFSIYKLPVPDGVIFLDMPIEFSILLMAERENKITGKREKDIHERNRDYLKSSYENSLYVADKYKWSKISCVDGKRLRTIEEIHDDVYEKVKLILDDKNSP
ncbi:MAG: dTMP kinase [Bacillota bacterium]|jgi:dTMP kinase|nr:thymidylate kinase [Clostridia bacterium]